MSHPRSGARRVISGPGIADSGPPPHPADMSYLGQLLAVAAVVMGIAQTITRERMFEPLRNRLGGHETWLG